MNCGKKQRGKRLQIARPRLRAGQEMLSMEQSFAAADENANPACSSNGDKAAEGAVLMDEFRAALRNPATLRQFITHGAELVPVEAWRKAFLWACASERVDFVSEFMNSSPFQRLVHTARDADEYTALHRAVVRGNLEIVKLLSRIVYYPFQVLHARTRNGWTALHLAVCNSDTEMVDLLMKWYEEIDLPSPRAWDFRDSMWMTPLQYGVLGGSHQVVARLLHSEAFRHHVNAVDYFGRSALHMACGHGAPVLVEELLGNRFVDPNSVDCCAYTPLHWAVYAGAADAVRSFTSRATERRILTTEEDSQGRPVLQIAIEYQAIDHKVGRDIQKLLLTVPEVKDEVEGLYRDRQVFVDAANAILVGAALIASVTFGGWLQPPEGSDSEVRIFWVLNSLSFFFSLATVLAGAGTVLPMSDVYIGKTVRSIRRWLAVTSFFLLISVLLVLGAFAAAGFASLPPIPFLHRNMTTTTSIGTVVCGMTGLFFLNRLLKIKVLDDFMVLFSGYFPRTRSTRRRSMVEVNTALDESRARVIGQAGVDFLRSRIEGSYDLANTVSCFKNAYEKEAHIRRHVVSDKAVVVKKRMKVFEEAFQEIRNGLDEEEATLNMLTLTELSHDGLHFWSGFPSVHCRERALEKDLELWTKIKTNVLRDKRIQLEYEYTEFDYTVSFDKWNI